MNDLQQETNKSLIPQIQTRHANSKWSNTKDGKNGGYFEFDGWDKNHPSPNINLYFHEFHYWINDDGVECQCENDYPTGRWEQNKYNHIIATGFIAFYLYWIQSDYKNRPIVDLFDTYFIHLRNIYIAEKKTCLEFIKTTDDKFNIMFYTQHITEERQCIENSQLLFEYLMPQDKEEIQRYIDAYFEHIIKYNPIQNTISQPEADEQPKSKANEVNTEKMQPNFATYLYHSNKEALMQKLHELLDNKKCKTVAITIKALIDLSFLVGYDSKSDLYNAMRIEFNFLGTNSALNKFLNSNDAKITETDIKPTKEILKAVK